MNAPNPRALEDELAAGPLDSDDLVVLHALRAYYDETDPVPPGLAERIKFELTLDALHAELATLTQLELSDSGARGATTEDVRTITFTADSLTMMITVSPNDDGTVRVDGWAAPGANVRIEARLTVEVRETVADEDGRFVFEALPTGLARFSLYVPRGEDVTTVVTPTLEL